MADPLSSMKITLDVALVALKAIRIADSAFTAAEMKLKLADVVDSLVDAKMALAEAQDEARALRDQIDGDRARLREAFVRHGEFYYLPNDLRGWKKGHYCATCFGRDDNLIPVHIRKARGDYHQGTCPACGTFGSFSLAR